MCQSCDLVRQQVSEFPMTLPKHTAVTNENGVAVKAEMSGGDGRIVGNIFIFDSVMS